MTHTMDYKESAKLQPYLRKLDRYDAVESKVNAVRDLFKVLTLEQQEELSESILKVAIEYIENL